MTVIYPEIAKLGTIVGVWAHPDDESWCAAGVLAAAITNGQRVVCVTATRGEAGMTDGKQVENPELAATRERELAEAIKILGITEHNWLDYNDGHCHEVDKHEAAAKLVPIIVDFAPDTIITFGSDGLTGHPDHQSVSRWTDEALVMAKLSKKPQVYHKVESQEYYERLGKKIDSKFDLYFMTDQPPLVPESKIDLAFNLPPELIDRKLKALAAQASQMGHILDGMTPAELQDFASFEGFMLAS